MIFGKNSSGDFAGRRNGWGAILFETAKDAQAAKDELEKQYIGSRYVNLFVIPYKDYIHFNKGSSSSDGPKKTSTGDCKLSDCGVNDSNRDKALVFKGLPFRVTVDELIDFVKDHGTITADNIFIEEADGRRSGSCLIFFQSEKIAQDVKENLDGETIGGTSRYVKILDHNDDLMKKICRIFDE